MAKAGGGSEATTWGRVPPLHPPSKPGSQATATSLVETTNIGGSIQHPILTSIMDDEPILDCIVVAAMTDRSSTMAPKNKPSTTPSLGASKVDAAHRHPEQSQTTKTPSSSSAAAVPQSRHVSVSYIRLCCSDTSALCLLNSTLTPAVLWPGLLHPFGWPHLPSRTKR